MASLAESLARERAGIFKPDRAWYRPVPTTVPFGQLVRSEASPWATAFQVEHVTAAASRKTGKRRLGLVNFVQRSCHRRDASSGPSRLVTVDPKRKCRLVTGKHCYTRGCGCQGHYAPRCTNQSRPVPTSADLRASPLSGQRWVWVHVPKCGSSFLKVLLQPGLCPGFPSCARLEHTDAVSDFLAAYAPGTYCPFASLRPATNCTLPFSRAPQLHPWTSCHDGWLSERRAGDKGLIMLREPTQRLRSGYADHQHGFYPKRAHLPWLEYANALQGCATRMLGGKACIHVWQDRAGHPAQPTPLPTQAEVAAAVRSLSSDFVFVGLTEKWGLSICLFHVRFGLGDCRMEESVNTAIGRVGAPRRHEVGSTGRDFVDRFDAPVYEEARRLFAAQLAANRVDEARCRAMGCL